MLYEKLAKKVMGLWLYNEMWREKLKGFEGGGVRTEVVGMGLVWFAFQRNIKKIGRAHV